MGTGSLASRIADGSARTVVLGLGYVGLPFAVLHARAGFHVTGIERFPHRRDAVNRGESYIEEVPSSVLATLVSEGRLRATSEFDAIGTADVVSICVPTPLGPNRTPDVSFIEQVLEGGRSHFHKGQLVVLESTTYPGTTREILVPFFESLGFTIGVDFFVAFAPERIDPGSGSFAAAEIPRVIGGVTERCSEVASAFYRRIVNAEVMVVSSPAVAEMSKMIENVFRIVNVSLMNELALLADRMGINLWEAIAAAETKPFGYMAFFPGPGVGGHCIPIDPFYLSWKARQYGFETKFIELAGEVNDRQPHYIVDQVTALLAEQELDVSGARILLLGVAYKKNVPDCRESPALRIAEELARRGASVAYHDPFVPRVVLLEDELISTPLDRSTLESADLVVVTTDHDGVNYDLVANTARLVYDTRNAIPSGHPAVRRLGSPTR